jgi:hypothetical protein
VQAHRALAANLGALHNYVHILVTCTGIWGWCWLACLLAAGREAAGWRLVGGFLVECWLGDL